MAEENNDDDEDPLLAVDTCTRGMGEAGRRATLRQRLMCGMTCGGLQGGLYAGNDAGKDSDNNSLVEALPRERLEGLPGVAMYWSENYSYIDVQGRRQQ